MARQLTKEEVNSLLNAASVDHVFGIEALFGVKLTDQQKQLVNLADDQAARVAISSCTGSGKTAVLCMMTLLYLMILPDCRILITSPSSQQLTRVFNAELNKWHRKLPPQFQDSFRITRERVDYTASRKQIQFAQLVTANVENQESLQGGHADNYVIFVDEASGIDDDSFKTLQKTLSTGKGGRFILASNPVRSSGRFYEIFRDNDPEVPKEERKGNWDTVYFSAYDSPNVNNEWIQEAIDDYGEDSDYYRVAVLGRFPRVGVSQYISADIVEECLRHDVKHAEYSGFPKVMGVDIARFGDDRTCIAVRQGPKLIEIVTFKGLDTMEVTTKVAEYYAIHRPSAIYVDSIGVGAGVFDRCKELDLPVSELIVSTKSTQPMLYSNLRAQLWGEMKAWLHNGADLPYSSTDPLVNLMADITGMQYLYNNKGQVQMMTKKDLKKLNGSSPDTADALSYTFAGEQYALATKKPTAKKIRRVNYAWI